MLIDVGCGHRGLYKRSKHLQELTGLTSTSGISLKVAMWSLLKLEVCLLPYATMYTSDAAIDSPLSLETAHAVWACTSRNVSGMDQPGRC